jgi:hypothetical protein
MMMTNRSLGASIRPSIAPRPMSCSESWVPTWIIPRSFNNIAYSWFSLSSKIAAFTPSSMEEVATIWWLLILWQRLAWGHLLTPIHTTFSGSTIVVRTRYLTQHASTFLLVLIMIMLIVMLYRCKLALFCWVTLGSLILMLFTMVELINILSCTRERNLLYFLLYQMKLCNVIGR